MPKNKTIFFDCDHVLLDSQKAFAEFIRKELKLPLSAYEQKYKIINDWKCLPHSIPQILRILEDWQRTDGFENIPALYGAKTAVKKFKKAGYDLTIITAAGKLPIAKQRRIINIENIFGKAFNDIIMVNWNQNKNIALKKFAPSFFIEDNIKNAVNALDINFKPILIQNHANKTGIAAHKSELKKIKIFSTWKEITDYILD